MVVGRHPQSLLHLPISWKRRCPTSPTHAFLKAFCRFRNWLLLGSGCAPGRADTDPAWPGGSLLSTQLPSKRVLPTTGARQRWWRTRAGAHGASQASAILDSLGGETLLLNHWKSGNSLDFIRNFMREIPCVAAAKIIFQTSDQVPSPCGEELRITGPSALISRCLKLSSKDYSDLAKKKTTYIEWIQLDWFSADNSEGCHSKAIHRQPMITTSCLEPSGAMFDQDTLQRPAHLQYICKFPGM